MQPDHESALKWQPQNNKCDNMRKGSDITKMKEIEESVGLVKRHLPPAFEEFANMGLGSIRTCSSLSWMHHIVVVCDSHFCSN